MSPIRMHLKVLLPFQIFADKAGVSRIVAETRDGSFGLLPHRLDCVASLPPGILIFETEEEGEDDGHMERMIEVRDDLQRIVDKLSKLIS